MFFSPSCTLKSQFQLPYHKTSNFSVNKPSPNWRMPSISKCRKWQKDHNALFEWGQRYFRPWSPWSFFDPEGFLTCWYQGYESITCDVYEEIIFEFTPKRQRNLKTAPAHLNSWRQNCEIYPNWSKRLFWNALWLKWFNCLTAADWIDSASFASFQLCTSCAIFIDKNAKLTARHSQSIQI